MSSEHFKYLKELDSFRNEVKTDLLDAMVLSLAPFNCQAFVSVWKSSDKWNDEVHIKIVTASKTYKRKFDIEPMVNSEAHLKGLIMEGCRKIIQEILTETIDTEIIQMRFK